MQNTKEQEYQAAVHEWNYGKKASAPKTRTSSFNEASLNVVKALEQAEAHAERLAEALREIAPTNGHLPPPVMVRQIAKAALAEWDKSKS